MNFLAKLEQNNLHFDENQLKAITHVDGPLLVAAGPGSGKTSVITARTSYLIHEVNINPSNILVITFTRAAANEMKKRFLNLPGINYNYSKQVDFGTFHSIFYKIICNYYGRYLPILEPLKANGCVKRILKSLNIPHDDDTIQNTLNDISLARTAAEGSVEFKPKNLSNSMFGIILSRYEKYKRDNKLIDFDDMLIICKKIFESDSNYLNSCRKKYRYILVDEFQDTCRLEFDIIKLLSSPLNNICVVGDDDQAIYGFRGTMPDCLLDFRKFYDSCASVILNINYRSTGEIVLLSKKIICHNDKRVQKELTTFRHTGEKPHFITPSDEEYEADFVCQTIQNMVSTGAPYSSFAVLYRTNIQSRAVVDELINKKIPFNVRDGLKNFFGHWICKDITCYLRLAVNRCDKSSFVQIVNRPFRRIKNEIIHRTLSHADTSLLDYIIFENSGLKRSQLDEVKKLFRDLDMIKNAAPFTAVEYIRKSVHYDDYIRKYCIEQNISCEEFFSILDEYSTASSKFETIRNFLSHIDEITSKLKDCGDDNKHTYDCVTLSTIHSAKGLEFGCVFLIGCTECFMPHSRSLETGDGIQEERRLFYVAVTRAKDIIYISSPSKHNRKHMKVSRFAAELFCEASQKPNKVSALDMLKTGELISHRIYGTGRVSKLWEDSVEIQFGSRIGLKTLDIDTCIKKKLIEK